MADKQVLEAPAALSRGDIDPKQLEGLLIDSQFAVLEEPTNEEDIITIEGSRNPDDIESNFISIIGAEV